jgi:hypothetical protein
MTLFTAPDFPNSFAEPFEVTSPSSGEYNCIAWALNDQTRFIWPLRQRGFYWPRRLPVEETLEAFTKLFAAKKYQVCEDGSLEAGFQKLALFEKDGIPTHAARQLPDGNWTSKLGAHIDVRHSLGALDGGRYGNVALFFKKPI